MSHALSIAHARSWNFTATLMARIGWAWYRRQHRRPGGSSASMAIIQVMMLTGAGAVTMAIGAGGAPSAKATRAAGDETRVATGYRPPVTGM